MDDNCAYRGVTIDKFTSGLRKGVRVRIWKALASYYQEEIRRGKSFEDELGDSEFEKAMNQDISVLAEVSKTRLIRRKNFGNRSLEELEHVLKQYNIELSI